MRGKVAYVVKLFLCFRITPAYAGKREEIRFSENNL